MLFSAPYTVKIINLDIAFNSYRPWKKLKQIYMII